MSQFYSNYQKMAAERAARPQQSGNFTKIGFFGSTKDAAGNRVKYMTNSGDAAIVRINYGADPNELLGAEYGLHPAGDGVRIHGRPFQKVACLGDNCPICKAIAAGDKRFGKATQRVFIPMVIAYRLPNGTFTTPEPIAMDAAGYMVEHLVQLMGDYGPLRDIVFKMTRTGTGTDTRYSFSFVPMMNNEDVITKASLDAFKSFDVTKHSYWVKSAEDINTFLATGTFPEAVKEDTATVTQPAFTAPAQPAVNVAPTPAPNAFAAAEANPFSQPNRQPAGMTANTSTSSAPTRDYSGFKSTW